MNPLPPEGLGGPLGAQLGCDCGACTTWRRLGCLLGIGHHNTHFTAYLQNELGDLLVNALDNYKEASGGSTPGEPLAEGLARATSPSNSRRSQEGGEGDRATSPEKGAKKEEKSPDVSGKQSPTKVEREVQPKVSKGPKAPKEKASSSKRSKKARTSSSPGRGKKEKSKRERPAADLSPEELSLEAEERKEKKKRPRTPSRSPGKKDSSKRRGGEAARPSSSITLKEAKGNSGEEDPPAAAGSRDKPPGDWTGSDLQPRPPAHPPPGYRGQPWWKRPTQRNKGKERERRLEDIKRHGPDPNRKWWRETGRR